MPSEKLSVYFLTYQSAKYLTQILEKVAQVADEILVVDSGSTDETMDIARRFGCKILTRGLDNFREQRAFAVANCVNHWVLSFDSDEIPSQELVDAIKNLKNHGFLHQAYTIRRDWNVLGKSVHAMFPVCSPDYPIRLFNKQVVCYDKRSTQIHETPHGYKSLGVIEEPMLHITFETKAILETKLKHYASIGAIDLIERGRSASHLKLYFSPIAAWLKWYFMKGSWKDGYTGILLSNYAMRYTFKKYKNAMLLNHP